MERLLNKEQFVKEFQEHAKFNQLSVDAILALFDYIKEDSKQVININTKDIELLSYNWQELTEEVLKSNWGYIDSKKGICSYKNIRQAIKDFTKYGYELIILDSKKVLLKNNKDV